MGKEGNYRQQYIQSNYLVYGNQIRGYRQQVRSSMKWRNRVELSDRLK